MIPNSRADEVSAIGIEPVTHHEIHAAKINETKIDGNLLAVREF
jgi:hypothetical protein